MKKINALALLIATFSLSLAACQKSEPKTPSDESVSQEESKEPVLEPGATGDALKYQRGAYTSSYRGLRINGMGYVTENFNKVSGDGGTYFAITDVKALAVAVDFTDYPASALPKGEEGTIKDLQAAIFGKSEDTGWESLKSYYDKTSNGICNIEGTVVNQWYHTNVDVKGFYQGQATLGVTGTSATKTLARLVSEWARDDLGMDLKDYDANGDGFIDSVIMIYSCPPHVDVPGLSHDQTDDLYWAFCWSGEAKASDANVDNPYPYRFFWSSYYTFYEDGYYDETNTHRDWTNAQIASGEAKIDSHTLIHEFGHALSLPDYYNGDYNSSDPYAYDPLGCLDMMAYNVGDHNAFSKALYGWTAPYLVYGESTVNIRSTTDTGDFIVIPVNKLERPDREFTLLSQYIMIEYLTPTGVAYSDSLDAYAGSYPVWYSEPGVRVTLVDARIGRFSYGGAFQGFTGSVSAGTGYYASFACDNNSIERSFDKRAKLIEIIPANGIPAKNLTNHRADNSCLYQEGAEFNMDTSTSVWKNFCVDDNAGTRTKQFVFGFKIEKMTKDLVSISFTGGFPEEDF